MGKNTINTFKTCLLVGYFIFWIKQQHHVTQYLNCKISHGGTLLQPWPNAFGMWKYFSEDYIIRLPKFNEHQKKEVFVENWNGFSLKLGEELGLFRQIIQRSNFDGGTSKSRWGDAKSRWGDCHK